VILTDIRFSRDRRAVDGPVDTAELLALLKRPNFDVLVAEPIGQVSRASTEDFAQVADLGGMYRFEVSTSAAGLSGTMLASPEDVVAAFADWATDRSGWKDQHAWD